MMLFSVYNVSDRYIASNTMLKAAAMCPMARKKTAKHMYNSHSTLKATVRFCKLFPKFGLYGTLSNLKLVDMMT